jgi:transcriptional regulator with XRE-family HTH domain
LPGSVLAIRHSTPEPKIKQIAVAGAATRDSEKTRLRQIDVAERLDCPQTRISKYELGTRRLDLLELRDVCNVLGVSLVDFVRTFDTAVAAVDIIQAKSEGRRGRSGIKG